MYGTLLFFHTLIVEELVQGIRTCVGKESGRLSVSDTTGYLHQKHFKERVKYEMRTTGQSAVPSKFDFEFTDFAPVVFHQLRQRFGVQSVDYLVSLTTLLI
jgi:hypothetical protein